MIIRLEVPMDDVVIYPFNLFNAIFDGEQPLSCIVFWEMDYGAKSTYMHT